MSRFFFNYFLRVIKEHRARKTIFNIVITTMTTLFFGCNKHHESNHNLQQKHFNLPIQVKKAPDYLNIIPRAEWATERPRFDKFMPMNRIYRVTIHHTATEDGELSGTTSTILQKILHVHKNHNGWADIGYHFIIDTTGKVWEGRNIQYQGAHAGSGKLNEGNIGIALIGNFEINKPSLLQTRTLKMLIRQLKFKYSIEGKNIFGHGHLKNTKCPGQHLHSVIESLRMEN